MRQTYSMKGFNPGSEFCCVTQFKPRLRHGTDLCLCAFNATMELILQSWPVIVTCGITSCGR